MAYVKELESIILSRKSIRKYDSNKIISNEKINSILEYARHVPSSYGLEPWKILVICNKAIQLALQPIINNQEQVSTCSHLFILLSYRGESFNTDNTWFSDTIKKKHQLNEEQYQNYKLRFKNFFDSNNSTQISHWAQCQTFILLQNLLLLLTAHEIDNVVLGGFNEKELLLYLEKENLIEPNKYHVTVLVSTGYGFSSEVRMLKNDVNDMSKIIK